MLYASKSMRGFYSSEIHGENLPADAVEISADHHRALLIAESMGSVIEWGGDVPIVREYDSAELWAICQAKARKTLAKNDSVAIRCLKVGIHYPGSWRLYDVALREIVRATSGDPFAPFPEQPPYPA